MTLDIGYVTKEVHSPRIPDVHYRTPTWGVDEACCEEFWTRRSYFKVTRTQVSKDDSVALLIEWNEHMPYEDDGALMRLGPINHCPFCGAKVKLTEERRDVVKGKVVTKETESIEWEVENA